jgi:predicted nucleotidyltransferase
MGISTNVLKSFDVKNTLNPEIWSNSGELHPHIRKQLLIIAKEFFEELDLGDVKLRDVTLTGSIANYNWSEFSDIDLHLRIKFSDVDDREALVKNLMLAKKSVWNTAHNITIKGFPVEVYVENEGEDHVASGLYSILRNAWLVKPEKSVHQIDIADVRSKAMGFYGYLQALETQFKNEEYVEVISGVKDILDKLKRMRQAGLSKGGEYSVENLAFKALRRSPFIATLVKLRNTAYDKSKSISEVLNEAHPLRDKVLRTVAEEAFNKILRFISKPANFKSNVKRVNKSYVINTKLVDKRWDNIRIIIAPENNSIGGGFVQDGVGKDEHILYLNIISSLGSAYGPPQRSIPHYFKYAKTTFIHEFTHYLDFTKRGATPTYGANDVKNFTSGKDLSTYVNNPTEFNAFYQQGATKFEGWVKEAMRKHDDWEDIIQKYIPKRLDDFVKSVFTSNPLVSFWPSKFIKTLDSNYKRKFLKRVAPLHKWASTKLYPTNETLDEEAERDYKKEYEKYQSSPEKKKYRAQLNKYNRDKGTYGNGDGKDASHKNGKIVGFEKSSINKGRAEKSRLKGSKRESKS